MRLAAAIKAGKFDCLVRHEVSNLLRQAEMLRLCYSTLLPCTMKGERRRIAEVKLLSHGCTDAWSRKTSQYYRLGGHTLDWLLAREDLPEFLPGLHSDDRASTRDSIRRICLRRSSHQEVWAAGVTYFRSRGARMEEVEGRGRRRFLRSRLLGRAAGTLLQIDGQPHGRHGRQGAHSRGCALVCARAGIDAGGQPRRAGSSATPSATT